MKIQISVPCDDGLCGWEERELSEQMAWFRIVVSESVSKGIKSGMAYHNGFSIPWRVLDV